MNSTDKFFTTTGAVAGVPLALLINRYLLGNKSSKSKWIAGAIGAGAGAATGLGVSTYMAGKAYSDPERASALDQYTAAASRAVDDQQQIWAILDDPNTDFSDPATRERLAQLYAPYGGMPADLPRSIIEYSTQADADADARALDITRQGMDMPLVVMSSDDLRTLMDFADRYRTVFGARPGTVEESNLRMYGGVRPEEYSYAYGDTPQQVFGAIHLDLTDGDGKPIPRPTLAAMMVYQNNLKNIYTSSFYNDDSKLDPKYRVPEVLDFLAIQAMPADMRERLPIDYRITAIARARLSNGWSLSHDRQMLFDPEYRRQAPAIPALQDQTLSVAGFLTALATAQSPGFNMLADLGLGLANGPITGRTKAPLPRWTAEMDLPENDTFASGILSGVRYNRNRAIRLLSGDPEMAAELGIDGVPMYNWMLTDAQRKARHTAWFNLVEDAAWAATDLYQLRSSLAAHYADPTNMARRYMGKRALPVGAMLEGGQVMLNGIPMYVHWNRIKNGITGADGKPLDATNLSDNNAYLASVLFEGLHPSHAEEGNTLIDQIIRNYFVSRLLHHRLRYEQAWGN